MGRLFIIFAEERTSYWMMSAGKNFHMDEFGCLLQEGDEAYKRDNYNKAIICYEDAFKIATGTTKFKFKSLLPMMARCYRKIGNSASVVNLAADAKKKFGRDVITSVFLTSIAAAYLDLGNHLDAQKCVDAAIMLENGKISGPLQAVIDRIEK